MSCPDHSYSQKDIQKDEELTANQRGGVLVSSYPIGLFGYIGRFLIALPFIVMGVLAAMNFQTFSATISQLGLPQPAAIAIATIVFRILGGLLFTNIVSIPSGLGLGQLMLLVSILFTMYFVHNPVSDRSQLENFLKDLAILGALLIA